MVDVIPTGDDRHQPRNGIDLRAYLGVVAKVADPVAPVHRRVLGEFPGLTIKRHSGKPRYADLCRCRCSGS